MNFRISNFPTERLQTLLPLAASLLFAVLLGLEAARLIWALVPAPEQGLWVPRPPQPITAQSSPNRPQVDLAQLNAANLFGKYEEQSAPVAATEDAPDTNLRLKLRGIVAMEDAKLSRALIEAANGKLESYAVGKDVPGGAKLHSIYPDRVLLQRGGRLETLRLEKELLDTGAPARGSQADPRASFEDVGSAPQILDSSTAAKLTNIREELLNDPTKASEYLRVQPARSNGALKGYRIYPGRNRELFQEAGLRPGDIVTSINGTALDDPSKSLQMLGDLSQAQQLNLQIERGGQPHSLSVNLN